MKIDCATVLCGGLLSCYPVGFSQEISDRVVRLDRRDAQLLDIKELNDLAVEYRERLRALLASYRYARAAAQGDAVRQVYISYEAIFIRRQIADLWQVYRIVMADCHEMTADYLKRLRPHQSKQRILFSKDAPRVAA